MISLITYLGKGLNMKYYLVASFDNDSCSHIEAVQKRISKKYKTSRNATKPRILLETIEDPDFDKLDKLITGFLAPYKKFKVEVLNVSAQNNSYHSLNLNIESKGYIKRFNRCFNSLLYSNGFNVKSNHNMDELCIFLGNLNIKDQVNISNVDIPLNFQTIKVNKIELTKSLNNKPDSIIKTYTLRDY